MQHSLPYAPPAHRPTWGPAGILRDVAAWDTEAKVAAEAEAAAPAEVTTEAAAAAAKHRSTYR